MKIYVASSWRNLMQPSVVHLLRESGHEVYDFKNPAANDHGFHWTEIGEGWKHWTPTQFINALQHPTAVKGFESDMNALRECDGCVLLLPCGRSAHLELGWAVGAGKKTCMLLMDERDTRGHSMDNNRPCSACGDLDGCHLPAKPMIEPELMYRMCDAVVPSLNAMLRVVEGWAAKAK